MAEAILNQPQFQDADKAREYLEALRWPTGPVCPHCGSINAKHLALKGKQYRAGLFKCADCYEQFTVTVGTVFERSKIALNLWLQAVHLMCASKKGVSAKQLERMLGVTYKTAWFMCHRIREAMRTDPTWQMGGNGTSGIVEADETYWGNKEQGKGTKGYEHKMKLVSLVERHGEKRTFHVANVTAETARAVLKSQVHKDAHLMTDEALIYKKVGREFNKHSTVHHAAKEYARGNVTTNTIESSFAILKRGLTGTFHSVSAKHLQRYADEFDFRWNYRQSMGYDDTHRANIALTQIAGKRLLYKGFGNQPQANA